MFRLELYETGAGKQPVADFISALSIKMSSKMVAMLSLLEEYGTELRMPYTRYLEDGLFELRCQSGNEKTRALYFYYYDKTIVVTNGFIKKTEKTPSRELKLAKKRREDWFKRHQNIKGAKRGDLDGSERI